MVKLTTVSEFNISHLSFLKPDGTPSQALPEFAQNKETLVNCYKLMLLARHFDDKALSLQRTGQLGTYAQATGQEAVSVGIGQALQPDDIFVPYYRDHAALIQRKVGMEEILRFWGGDEAGANFQHNAKDFPYCVPIATQTLHAAGVATAIKYKNEKNAVLVSCGDGATSKGDFYEAMNIAGVWFLPLVFVIYNNQWAISVPRSQQSRAQTLAQKSIAAGIPGLQVDGNDVIAVTYAIDQALKKAREGKGPTVIEAVTYRLCDHTSADDASRYVNATALAKAKEYEPLIRTKKYLMTTHSWTESDDAQAHEECKKQVNKAAELYLASPNPQVPDMFDYLFAELPESLHEQRQALIQHAENKENASD